MTSSEGAAAKKTNGYCPEAGVVDPSRAWRRWTCCFLVDAGGVNRDQIGKGQVHLMPEAALAVVVLDCDFEGVAAVRRVGASDGCQTTEVVAGSDRGHLKHETTCQQALEKRTPWSP
jgi:hypothetical protein